MSLLTAGCNTVIDNLAIFVEKHCAPMTQDIKTRIKDTQHLLYIIDDLNKRILPPNTKLVAFDIHNMYPSTNNKRGVEVIRNLFNSRTTLKPSADCVIEALEICLTCNNSKFTKQNLLQSNGTCTVTGAPNSCSCADLAVSPTGDTVLSASENIFSEILYFGLYRDDDLTLWTGSMERLCQFRDFLNSLDPNLEFKMTVGENDELTFLDLRIILKNNKLFTTVYSEPTSSQMYLDADSIHPKSTFTGIQKGVSLRLRRICSIDEEFNERSKEYKAYLVAKGHNHASVLKEFDRTDILTKTQARVKRSDNPDKAKRLTIFVVEYNPRGPNIQDIIKRHLNILQENPEVKKTSLMDLSL